MMAGLGLVADYSSSEEELDTKSFNEHQSRKQAERKSTNYFECNDQDSTSLEKKTKKCKKSKKEKLANPLKGTSSNNLPSPFLDDETGSVFYNPFQKEQEDKRLMLEKHVKLSENPKDVVEINGKKICFNYRKGRCKFGHNCKFAHDSDLSTAKLPPVVDEGGVVAATRYNEGSSAPPPELVQERKRKPGLSNNLVPVKKSRNNYRMQQEKESPWMAKR